MTLYGPDIYIAVMTGAYCQCINSRVFDELAHRLCRVKIKYLLHIHIFASDDWHQVMKDTMAEQFWSSNHKVVPVRNSNAKNLCFTTFNWGHGVLKVKMKSMSHIYIPPLFDWYQVKRYRLSRFGGDATTKWYPLRDIQEKKVFQDL